MLLIVCCFGRRIRAAHSFVCFGKGSMLLIVVFFGGGGSVLLIVFCFGMGEGSLLLIDVSFGRVIRFAHRFLFWDGDPCCSSFCFGG